MPVVGSKQLAVSSKQLAVGSKQLFTELLTYVGNSA